MDGSSGPRWLRMSERLALGMEVDDDDLMRQAWERAGVRTREPCDEEEESSLFAA